MKQNATYQIGLINFPEFFIQNLLRPTKLNCIYQRKNLFQMCVHTNPQLTHTIMFNKNKSVQSDESRSSTFDKWAKLFDTANALRCFSLFITVERATENINWNSKKICPFRCGPYCALISCQASHQRK